MKIRDPDIPIPTWLDVDELWDEMKESLLPETTRKEFDSALRQWLGLGLMVSDTEEEK